MNYGNLENAVRFYSERGYVYLDDVPWTVGYEAYYATKPPGARDVMLNVQTPGVISFPSEPGPAYNTQYPVASAEQSFIQMMLDGQFVKRAIAVTPCFRAEPRVDTLHRPYFMKAELINAQDVDEGHLIHMIHDACAFFEQFFPVRVVKTEIGYDIVEKGTRFELGSYGIRNRYIPGTSGLKWIYGTACAEPRLSTAIAKHSKAVGR